MSAIRKNERPNGWYYITDRVEDSISLEPIVTINDFEEIKLDSAENLKGKFIYQITGHVAADCVEKWADATEHSIGKRIGFVLQDEVICTPCINCRIETGSFAISAQDTDIKSIYWQIVRKFTADKKESYRLCLYNKLYRLESETNI